MHCGSFNIITRFFLRPIYMRSCCCLTLFTMKRIRISNQAENHPYNGTVHSIPWTQTTFWWKPASGKDHGYPVEKMSLYFSSSTRVEVIEKHLGSLLEPKGNRDSMAMEILGTAAVNRGMDLCTARTEIVLPNLWWKRRCSLNMRCCGSLITIGINSITHQRRAI